MAQNGRLSASDLRAIPGGRLRKDAGASWLRMRNEIGRRTGVWICPTSARTAYRTYAEQVYFWDLYQRGQGNLAAYPGTSNHGWGIAVDVPSPTMARLINQYGAEYGWQKRWSDAPSEWWHFRYASQYDKHRGKPLKPRPKGRRALRKGERMHRDRLVRARAFARKRGGWETIPKHKQRAAYSKAWLRRRRRAIHEAAKREGWQPAYRRERYDYIGKLVN